MIARGLAHRILTKVLVLALASLAVAASASADVITGTVKTATGQPVGGSRVDALQAMGGGVYTLRASAFVSKTDGSYVLTGLPADTYVVRFQGNATSMREYYDDVPNRSMATSIAVAADGTVPGIDAVLAAYPKLRGVVRSTFGAPLAGIAVTVVRAQDQTAVGSATSAADGGYAVTLLDDQAAISSAYKLRFVDPLGGFINQWHRGKRDFATANVLTLPPGTTTIRDAALVQGGFISGRVVDQDGDPIHSGVHISLETGGVAQRLATAADGSYRSKALPPGTYEVWFGGDLYAGSEYYDDSDGSVGADPVVVTAGATTSGIAAQLQRNGAIHGRVTGADGRPVRFVRVRAYTPAGTLVQSATTSDRGDYGLGRLPAGEYKLRLEPDVDGNAAQWYPGKGTLQDADSVTVVKGAATTVDARVGVGARIVGTLGAPVGLADMVTVELYDVEGQRVGAVRAQAGASYALQGVPPGSYRLCFRPDIESRLMDECHDDAPTLDSADPIVVGADQTVTVSPTLELGRSIAGHVTRSDGQPTPQVFVLAYDTAGDVAARADTDDNGDYELVGLRAGTYRVRFIGPGSSLDVNYPDVIPPDAGFLEDEYYDDKPTLETATPVSVTAPTTTVDEQLVSTGSIWGTVRTADGAPLKGARVFLVREDGRRAGPFVTRWNGQYRAEILRPGRWKVFFASPYTAYASGYYDDKATLADADAVTVVDHDVQTGIDGALVRQPSLTSGFALPAAPDL